MVISTLRRKTTVTDPAEFDKRAAAMAPRLLAILEKQQGFISHELSPDGEGGGMVQVTRWQADADCRAYLRNGAAAMVATILDGFFPTAPYPNGNWVRETVEASA